MEHPYKSLPARAFWKRSVSENWDVTSVPTGERLIRTGDTVASAGSCFASNIVPYLEQAGIRYLRVEHLSSAFGKLAEDNFGYSKFSANYGNIYTVRHAVQLLLRALGRFTPAEDRWALAKDLIVDPFRPGLKYPASSAHEFELLTAQHLRNVLAVFRRATVFVFTLGLTEAWISKLDGAAFPACPGTIRGEFDPARHAFHNFTLAEVAGDLDQFILLAREINPSLRFVLTVSPVPLVATATGEHVLTATTYSKSVLRVAAGEAIRRHADVAYFPAYEIVAGPQAPKEFFESDRREPSVVAIRYVMRAFLACCDTAPGSPGEDPQGISVAIATERQPVGSIGSHELSQLVAEANCEEAAAGIL
jgi:GSCFA family